MAKYTKSRLRRAGILLIVIGFPAYWYLFSHYGDPHLFMNTYGNNLGPWRWRLKPPPIVDHDGTKVFVDYSANELAIVFDSVKESGWFVAGHDDAGGLRIILSRRAVTIPILPDRCMVVDESESRVLRVLDPGEARDLFERFGPMNNSGKLRAELQKIFPGMLPVAPAINAS